ncbi:MAG: hypothetical protein AAF539_07695, partial [Planctomycetota bacterium]
PDFDGLTFDESASKLAVSLATLKRRFESRPVAGLLLFSDGNDDSDPFDDDDTMPFPIYPIVSADYQPDPDVRIDRVQVSQSEFETAPMTVRVHVASTHQTKETFRIAWIDPSGKVVDESLVACEGGSAEAEFRFRPDASGVQFYNAAVSPESARMTARDWANDRFPSGIDEANWANNQTQVTIDRRGGPFRVLYLAGRPNWEFKFLRRALTADPETQLVGLLRIADKEPKFSFRDSKVGNTNPLFAGLDDDEAELREQLDEPVFIRLGVRDGEELSDGIPRSIEEWFGYDAIILDDAEPGFLTEDQMLQLKSFVTRRGGGVMFLGGQESNAPNLMRTPLADLLPVYPPSSRDRPEATPVTIGYTREGMLQPWLRLRATEDAETARLRNMPGFETLNAFGRIKPGGVGILARVDQREKPPLMATQRFGRGRVSALAIGDLWRYQTRPDSSAPGDGATWWRQMIRWLMSDVPRQIELSLSPTDSSVDVAIRVVDDEYQPLENAGIDLKAIGANGVELPLPVTPDANELGVYRSSFTATQPDAYRIVASVTNADGSPLGQRECGWVADPLRDEIRHLAINRTNLGRLAESSGGRLVTLDELPDFAASFSKQDVPVMQAWTAPIWHTPWILASAIACLAGEWGIRRWRGWA